MIGFVFLCQEVVFVVFFGRFRVIFAIFLFAVLSHPFSNVLSFKQCAESNLENLSGAGPALRGVGMFSYLANG